MQELKGKVAVITGAAEGIGKALAIKAAAEGMKLVLADIDATRLEATVAELAASGAQVIGAATDVAKANQIDALAELAFSLHGNVHLLINNAGVACAKPVWEVSEADWEWVMGVNLYGVTHALRSFLPRMLSAGEEGHVVNTASMAGLLSQPSMATYNATKHAVVTVSEGLHFDLQLRQSKLKVSVLCPAWVKTRIASSERNRGLSTGSSAGPGGADPVVNKLSHDVQQAVAHGIEPAQVAEAVFEAIRSERFYVLTHPAFTTLVRTRMEDVLEGRSPTFMPPR
jgi:NAD(P)-dependent dehydrogenase (short-subunit alcohol dehydrogenase family)